MRIMSWNVNGLRACAKKGFVEWLGASGADIVGLQEVRAKLEQLDAPVREPEGWHTAFSPAERPGYSGVALFSQEAAEEIQAKLGEERFDCEGRFQWARFGPLSVVNVYFPNGSGKNRDNSRIPYKIDFYQRAFELLESHRASGERIIVMGDFNTAHQEIDLARPKQNHSTSGFCAEEREELDRWLRAGWTDAFRSQTPEGGHYTWWSNRPGVRERNVGWRIDYMLLSPGVLPFLERAFHCPEVRGSDHCPIGVDLRESVLAED